MSTNNLNLLPELCYAFLETNAPGKQIIAIRRGINGYQMTTFDEENAKHAQAIVNKMNEKLDVNPLQAECMLVGSMFGWNAEGANYELASAKQAKAPKLAFYGPGADIWNPVEALEQARAALPDASMAEKDGVSSDLIKRIDRVIEAARVGNTSPVAVMSMLSEARKALPGAWESHGGVSTELLEAIDKTIAGTSTTILQGKNLLAMAAEKFGVSLSTWEPSGENWEYTNASFGDTQIRLAVSSGGVVQVNRDPFTPAPERKMNVTIDAIETSLMAAANIQYAQKDKAYLGTVVTKNFPSVAIQDIGKGTFVAHRHGVAESLEEGKYYTVKYDPQGRHASIEEKSKVNKALSQSH